MDGHDESRVDEPTAGEGEPPPPPFDPDPRLVTYLERGRRDDAGDRFREVIRKSERKRRS